MSWSGWLRLKRRPWREVCRAARLWGPSGCWDALLRVRVWEDCEREVLKAGRMPGKGAVTMRVDVVELATAVKAMRDAQNAYFRGGDGGKLTRLEESKQHERHVDRLVKAVLHPEPPGLFDGEAEA